MEDLSVSDAMRKEIEVFLKEVEEKHNVRILYACESGSRAWGFASPDSDYDIRFIYTSADSGKLSLWEATDNIEIPIENDLDAGGWNVKKSLSLLAKSNGALIEWLHSPIVYYAEDGFLDEWREMAKKVLAESNLVRHYRGHATQMWKGQLQTEQVRAKSYLYSLRTSLSAQWVEEKRSNPPVPFEHLLALLDHDMQQVVDQLLAVKSVSGEKELMDRVPKLDNYLSQYLQQPTSDDLSQQQDNRELLDVFYRRWSVRGARIESVAGINLSRVNQKDLLLFKAIAGSQAYGTNHAGSDIDYRGVFALPQHLLGGLESLEQVQDERGDDVYFELGKVVGMLQKNNPNLMELLFMPKECIQHKHPVWGLLDPNVFLSKKCELSFANYAIGQVKKARGLNKKIVNPEPETRKGLIDFCYVLQGQGSVPLAKWASDNSVDLAKVGIASSQHAPQVYSLYVGDNYRGMFSSRDEDELICSSVAIEAVPIAWMVCNKEAFSKHCRAHREYWLWVKNRNQSRYQSSNEAGYDAKNMMHTLRLLDVAEEIARDGVIHVRRPNCDFLMKVRSGEFAYDYLLDLAEEKMASVRESYEKSRLPEEPCFTKSNEILMEMRDFIG